MPAEKAIVLRIVFESAMLLLGVYVAWEQLTVSDVSSSVVLLAGIAIGRCAHGLVSAMNGKGM